MRRALILPALIVLVLVAEALPASSASPVRSIKFPCKTVGTAQLDPIVVPDGSPSAHEHMFAGNVGTPQGDHEYADMIDNPTSCKFAGDTAAYWVPTLRRPDGSLVPAKVTVYYDRMSAQPVTAFPPDFGMVWGSVRSPFLTKQRSFYGWTCQNTDPLQPTFTNVDCSGFPAGSSASYVTLRTFAPFCWDGVDPGVRNFGDHVFYPTDYPTNGTCPAGSMALPRIRVNWNYQTSDATGYTFASDALAGVTDGASAHVDFWNTWEQPALEGLVAQLNA